MKKTKSALLNAHYSANLGDGLLSDCLMFGLEEQLVGFPVDLAGREEITTLGGNRRGQILKILDFMPKFFRSIIIGRLQSYFLTSKWRPHFEKNLVNCESVILGGGNLIADQDLNFPTKIASALDVAQTLGLPCYLYAVGVGSSFSEKGEALFNEAFSAADIRSVYVRDIKSKMNWDKTFSKMSGCDAKVVWDPGMLASQKWPVKEEERYGPVRVGIISPNELNYHDNHKKVPDLTQWYKLYIDNLRALGFEVRLFSNGSPEDTRYLKKDILSACGSIGYDIPSNQGELARLVAKSSLVTAFRLHALIPAISYNRPILALAWDAKVKSFAEKIGRLDACLDIHEVSPETAVKIAIDAMAQQEDFSKYVNEAKAEIDRLGKFILQGVNS